MPQRNVSWIYQSPKSSTTSSSAAAQNFQSVTTPPELLFKLTDVQQVAEDGFKTITAERWRSFASMGRKLKLNTGRGTTSVKARVRSWSSTLQKIRQVKKTEIYCYGI